MKGYKCGFVFLLSVILITSLVSCIRSQSTTERNNSTKKEKYTNVNCQENKATKYSIYIPQYDQQEKLPVVLFFDPHAQGNIPVTKYSALADQYGYILIGSLNMQNGMDLNSTQHVLSALLKDITSNKLIDTKRIYLSGFSGGAKQAMIYGLQNPGIKGVVACAGSVNPKDFSRNDFMFVGIVGDKDFNFLDMQQTVSAFNVSKQPYSSIVFDGAHEWPPVDAYEKAFIAMEINAMKSGAKSKDNDWLNIIRTETINQADSVLSSNHKIKAIETLICGRDWLKDLTYIKDFENRIIQLQNDSALKTQLEKRKQLVSQEIQLRGQYTQAMYSKNPKWWKTQVSELRKVISGKDELLATTTQRLLNYLSMVSYMMCINDLNSHNLEEAYKKNQIYEMVDPENPGVYLMYARYYLETGNPKKMVTYFQKALDKGFDNPEQYKSDSGWQPLFKQPKVVRMMSKV